jgi:hypothetical protein
MQHVVTRFDSVDLDTSGGDDVTRVLGVLQHLDSLPFRHGDASLLEYGSGVSQELSFQISIGPHVSHQQLPFPRPVIFLFGHRCTPQKPTKEQ